MKINNTKTYVNNKIRQKKMLSRNSKHRKEKYQIFKNNLNQLVKIDVPYKLNSV
jgi:hypothetical protein